MYVVSFVREACLDKIEEIAFCHNMEGCLAISILNVDIGSTIDEFLDNLRVGNVREKG